MTKESRLFSAPSESYLSSYGSSVPSIDDRTYTPRELIKVCHKGPTITATNRINQCAEPESKRYISDPLSDKNGQLTHKFTFNKARKILNKLIQALQYLMEKGQIIYKSNYTV